MINKIRKLIKYFNYQRFKKNIAFLIKYDISDYINNVKDETLEDMVYEYDENKKILGNLHIKNEDETLDALYKKPKSFARFGDGELNYK